MKTPPQTAKSGQESAETLAAQALSWIAEDTDRLNAFMAMTGAAPADLMRDAAKQESQLATMPGRADTFLFRTRENGFGLLQILSVTNQAGPLLQAARKSAGLSQTALARRLDISQSRMSAMELDPGSISLAQLLAMCSALNLELLVRTKVRPGDERGVTTLAEPEW